MSWGSWRALAFIGVAALVGAAITHYEVEVPWPWLKQEPSVTMHALSLPTTSTSEGKFTQPGEAIVQVDPTPSVGTTPPAIPSPFSKNELDFLNAYLVSMESPAWVSEQGIHQPDGIDPWIPPS